MGQLLISAKEKYDLVMGVGKADELADKIKREEDKKSDVITFSKESPVRKENENANVKTFLR